MSRLVLNIVLVGLIQPLMSQDLSPAYRNFPVIITLQFHALSMPFRDVKSNFSNIGIGLGTEFSYSGKANWVQQVSAGWYHNRAVGNGLILSTQAVWRPVLTGNLYTEVKLGAGYLLAARPVEGFRYEKGNWIASGKKGKGMLTIPLGISLGYDLNHGPTRLSPFVSYQFLLVTKYNRDIPLVPETLIQFGSRLHFRD